MHARPSRLGRPKGTVRPPQRKESSPVAVGVVVTIVDELKTTVLTIPSTAGATPLRDVNGSNDRRQVAVRQPSDRTPTKKVGEKRRGRGQRIHVGRATRSTRWAMDGSKRPRQEESKTRIAPPVAVHTNGTDRLPKGSQRRRDLRFLDWPREKRQRIRHEPKAEAGRAQWQHARARTRPHATRGPKRARARTHARTHATDKSVQTRQDKTRQDKTRERGKKEGRTGPEGPKGPQARGEEGGAQKRKGREGGKNRSMREAPMLEPKWPNARGPPRGPGPGPFPTFKLC